MDPKEKLDSFLDKIDSDKEDYRTDMDMGSGTVERNMGLLSRLELALVEASKLPSPVLLRVLEAVEHLYPMNYYSGTGYGTCYGSRHVLNIVINASKMGRVLSGETMIDYVGALEELHHIRSLYASQVIPFEHHVGKECDGLFPFYTIEYLNGELLKTVNPGEQKKIMEQVLLEAREEHWDVLGGMHDGNE